MSDITVTVSASTGIGATTVASVIEDALKAAGFDVSVGAHFAMDHDEVRVNFEERVKSVASHRTVEVNTQSLNRAAVKQYFQEV